MRSWPAIFAPFIAVMGNISTDSIRSRLYRCDYCGLRFSEPRRSDLTESMIYAGYRDAYYNQTRQRFEPWYTPTQALAVIPKGAHLHHRAMTIEQRLGTCLGERAREGSTNFLDYGGGDGRLVAALNGSGRSWVYDISNAPLVPGVQRLAYGAKHPVFDVILCTGVLEHVSYPNLTLAHIVSLCAKKRTVVYLEVPVPMYSTLRSFRRFLSYMAHHPLEALRLLRFPGFWRQIHEHQSFFTLDALVEITKSAGLHCYSIGENDGCYWVVAMKTRDSRAK